MSPNPLARTRTLCRLALTLLSAWASQACGGDDGGGAVVRDRDGGSASDAGLSAPDQASVASNDPGAPSMLDLTVHSPAMKRDVQVRLLVPESFATQPERRYPVLYLLIGAGEPLGYKAWSEQSHVETLAAAHELLVAMPEGGQAGWYSDWLGQCNPGSDAVDNQPAWETFHTVELPAVLERFYRANSQRAIAGLSMGGLGATSYAARHPGMFSAVASFSGALRTSTNPVVQQVSLFVAGCGNTDAVWGSVAQQPEVWAAHDPYLLADKLLELPLYVAVGNGMPGPLDSAGSTTTDPLEQLAEGANREFTDRLTALGATKLVTHYYGAGTHSWPYWSRELEAAFPLLTAPLSAN